LISCSQVSSKKIISQPERSGGIDGCWGEIVPIVAIPWIGSPSPGIGNRLIPGVISPPIIRGRIVTNGRINLYISTVIVVVVVETAIGSSMVVVTAACELPIMIPITPLNIARATSLRYDAMVPALNRDSPIAVQLMVDIDAALSVVDFANRAIRPLLHRAAALRFMGLDPFRSGSTRHA
jgi:hypothetical protein